MSDERPSGIQLPDSLTRLLRAPGSAILPTPGDRGRLRQRPREPNRAVIGVWLWVILYNVGGFAILAMLWQTMP